MRWKALALRWRSHASEALLFTLQVPRGVDAAGPDAAVARQRDEMVATRRGAGASPSSVHASGLPSDALEDLLVRFIDVTPLLAH